MKITSSILLLATIAGIGPAVRADLVTFTNVADTTTTAPGQGAFTGFSNPSISGSNIAFRGSYSGGNGIYTGSVAATGAAKIVDRTDNAPGNGVFTGFSIPSVSGSNIAFYGTHSSGTGIYTGTVGAIGSTRIVNRADNAPGHGAFTSLSTPSISGSNVAFPGTYSGGSGIYTAAVGATGSAKVVDTGDTAPGHGVFTAFGNPSISGSNVAFRGSYSGGNGIYTGSVAATGAAKIVDFGDNAAGHGAFTAVGSDLSISGSNVVFIGDYSGGSGVYTGSVGATGAAKIVDFGDNAPGHGVFTDFGSPSISGSNVAFLGSYIGGYGLYLATVGGGSLSAVLNIGDALFGSTVTGFDPGSFGFDGNSIAFKYALANGRSGIGVANVSTAAVPEPSPVLFVSLAAALAGTAQAIRVALQRLR